MANPIYPDLENNFPQSVDDFNRFQDPTVSSLTYIQDYYRYFNAGNLVAAEGVLTAHPELKTMIIDAENLNKLRDAVISMERFYLSDFQNYVVNAFEYKGTWTSISSYHQFNIVYDGIEFCYFAIDEVPAGTPLSNTNYWQRVTVKGPKGDTGLGLSMRGLWNSQENYTTNDCVSYNNKLWGCSQPNTNQIPIEGSSYWFVAADFNSASGVSYLNIVSMLDAHDVQTAIDKTVQKINEHKEEIVNSTNGVHGIKLNNGNLYIYDETNSVWVLYKKGADISNSQAVALKEFYALDAIQNNALVGFDANGNVTDDPDDMVTFTLARRIAILENTTLANTLATLNDVQLVNLQDGQSLVYDSNLNKWTNGSAGTHIVQAPVPKTKTYTYDGTTQAFEFDSIDSNLVVVTNGSHVDAGTYTVICSLKNANDVWSDMTNTPKTFAWVIGKAAGDFTLSANSASVSLSNPTATVNVTNITGDGVVSVSSSDSTVVTASYSNGVVTITGHDNGTATITVSLAEGTNYLAKSKAISVTASGFMATFTVNGGYEDDITIKSADGQTTIATVVFDAGETSKQVSVPIPADGEYLFTSLDYENADGTDTSMEKVIKVDGNTQSVNVMPNGSQYWHGNEKLALSLYSYKSPSTNYNITNNSTKGTDKLNLNAVYSGSAAGVIGFISPQVDLTNYQRLKAKIRRTSASGYFGVAVASSPNPKIDISNGSTYTTDIITKCDYAVSECDISSVQQCYLSPSSMSWENASTITATIETIFAEAKRSLPAEETTNVTLTINGAKEDKITIYDKYGEVVDYVDFATGATSATVTVAIRNGGERLKFVSSVAKDIVDGTHNYYKYVTLTNSLAQTVEVYPNALIWYLRRNKTFEGKGWRDSLENPTNYPVAKAPSVTESSGTLEIDVRNSVLQSDHSFTVSKYVCDDLLDLSQVTAIKMEVDASIPDTPYGYIKMEVVSANEDGATVSNDIRFVYQNQSVLVYKGIVSLDVSSINSGYLWISLCNTSLATVSENVCKIKRIWLE